MPKYKFVLRKPEPEEIVVVYLEEGYNHNIYLKINDPAGREYFIGALQRSGVFELFRGIPKSTGLDLDEIGQIKVIKEESE